MESNQSSNEHLRKLLDRYADGSLTSHEKPALEKLLSESPEARARFWQEARLSALLKESCEQRAGRELLEPGTDTEPESSKDVGHIEIGSTNSNKLRTTQAAHQNSVLSASLALSLLVAMGIGSAITYWFVAPANTRNAPGYASNPQSNTRQGARLVNLTNCRWDFAHSTADVHSDLVLPGQSLNLLEGIAEITTTSPDGGSGRCQLEGPLFVMLDSRGMPNLQLGRLAAQVDCDREPFVFGTPLGRVVISREASIGLVAHASEVELHVFSGEAEFEPLLSTNVLEAEPEWDENDSGEELSLAAQKLSVAPGSSLRLTNSEGPLIEVEREKANRRKFITHVSMTASHLHISDQYVQLIKQAEPLVYWRFESVDNGAVPNEMGDYLRCQVHGEGVRWRSYQDNRSADFGSTDQLGYLATTDSLGETVADDYSMEAWIKPSHYHYGSFLMLLTNTSPQPDVVTKAGITLQLEGPSQHSRSRNAGEIRFTHRNPPGPTGGTTCYSQVKYSLRRWQHVAAIKDGHAILLYLNGKLVAHTDDATSLAPNLQVLLGQLKPYNPSLQKTLRPFVGEMDEVAIYDRALTHEEIKQRYKLARPTAKR